MKTWSKFTSGLDEDALSTFACLSFVDIFTLTYTFLHFSTHFSDDRPASRIVMRLVSWASRAKAKNHEKVGTLQTRDSVGLWSVGSLKQKDILVMSQYLGSRR